MTATSTPQMADPLTRYVAERESVLAALRQLLIERLGVRREPDEIDPDVVLFGSGLGLDSIDAVEMVVSLEERFGVRLADNAMVRAEMRTVNTLVDLILARGERHDGER